MLVEVKLIHFVNERAPSESRLLALSLTFASGFIDCYTYILRGHTLSAGQTGNIIFFATSLANRNLLGMITRGSTMTAFVVGLMIVAWFHKHVRSNYWRVFCLFPILIVCFAVGFIPASFPNYYLVPCIAFGLAVQNSSFSKIEGMAYNNAFTTGNLKQTAVAWSAYFFGADKAAHDAAVNYLLLVIAFFIGAIVSAVFQKFWGLQTIWFAGIWLAIVNIGYLLTLKKKLAANQKCTF